MKTECQLTRWQSNVISDGITGNEAAKDFVSASWKKHHVSNQIFPIVGKDKEISITTTIDTHIDKSVPRYMISDMFHREKRIEGAAFINQKHSLKNSQIRK